MRCNELSSKYRLAGGTPQHRYSAADVQRKQRICSRNDCRRASMSNPCRGTHGTMTHAFTAPAGRRLPFPHNEPSSAAGLVRLKRAPLFPSCLTGQVACRRRYRAQEAAYCLEILIWFLHQIPYPMRTDRASARPSLESAPMPGRNLCLCGKTLRCNRPSRMNAQLPAVTAVQETPPSLLFPMPPPPSVKQLSE